MLDTHQKGFVFIYLFFSCFFLSFADLISYLFQDKIEPLFASLFELIGLPTEEQCGANISQRQIAHLIQTVDESQEKRLSRSQFMNMRNTDWTDETNGIGMLLIEHSC
jgi:hypothetical protein